MGLLHGGKSWSIKIAHQMFWKIISAARGGKKKKETKFYFEGCVPRTSPLIFFKNHLSCLFHSSLEVNRFSEYTAAIETLHGRTETDCSGRALLVYFNQKALKLKNIYISIDILPALEYGVQNTGCCFDLFLNVSKVLLFLRTADWPFAGTGEFIFPFYALVQPSEHKTSFPPPPQ